MRTIVFACTVTLAAAGAAAAQGYAGYSGYTGYAPPKMGQDIRPPEPPKFPKPPKAPEFVSPPRFKQFTGVRMEAGAGGLDPYPKPKKPKGGFSTYDGR